MSFPYGYRFSTSNHPAKAVLEFLFCLDLSLSKSVDHQGLLIVICIRYLVVLNPPAVRATRPYVEDFSELCYESM